MYPCNECGTQFFSEEELSKHLDVEIKKKTIELLYAQKCYYNNRASSDIIIHRTEL